MTTPQLMLPTVISPTLLAPLYEAARKRSVFSQAMVASERCDLNDAHALQRTHLTCPATEWKKVEAAVTKSSADLVMLDLEDSIVRGDDTALERGRANIVRAFGTLDWGQKLRYFRPRGTDLDPGHEDLTRVLSCAIAQVQGVVLPKIEHADEVRSVDATLSALELLAGIPHGSIRLQILIESVRAEQEILAIATASKRLSGLIFGAFDYWSSLGAPADAYRPDHPMVDAVRGQIVKAAARVGVPAIAEMTLNFPTKDKSEEARHEALAQARRDAELARAFGMRGKWVGIPAQIDAVAPVFSLTDREVSQALSYVRQFAEHEREGRGAAMIEGAMADRATDRLHRETLKRALREAKISREIADEITLS
ncbi:MAG: aldolase/citrate lyase family protein [Deltaproteobacteria bacterium]|nr:aldolase/citrate lyase family protein [Deltaproteobacteria bacterium]